MEGDMMNSGDMSQSEGMDGHPSQAHADHAAIMKAHGILQNPDRMAGVHAIHNSAKKDLFSFYKEKEANLGKKEAQSKSAMNTPKPPHEETADNDMDDDMAPNPTAMAGHKKSAMMG